jgi:hypothetical protein
MAEFSCQVPVIIGVILLVMTLRISVYPQQPLQPPLCSAIAAIPDDIRSEGYVSWHVAARQHAEVCCVTPHVNR